MPKANKWIYWTPRILSIVFILFLALFSLDIFEMKLGFWGTIVGLFMHNIPSIILAIILWISWKREIVGAVAFCLGGILYTILNLINIIKTGFEFYYLAWIAQISGIAFIIAFLFWINWKKRKKK